MKLSIATFFALAALCVSLVHANSSLITNDHVADDASIDNRRISKSEKQDHAISLLPRLLLATVNVVDSVHTHHASHDKEEKGMYKVIHNFSKSGRKLSKTINNAVKKHLFKSSIATKKAAIKAKALLQGRRDKRHLAISDVMDEFEETAMSPFSLFEDFVGEGGFSFDQFISPPSFCSQFSLAGSDDCTQAVRAMGSIVQIIAMNPVVLYDIGQFVAYNLFMLPWDHILDWEKLRDYLNSIPKADLYASIVTEIDSILSEMSEDYEDYIPEVYKDIYTEIFEYTLDMESPIEFIDVISTIASFVSPYYEEYYDEDTIDFVHGEVCHILSLEMVHMDFISDCDGEHNMYKVPFCVSADFKAKYNGKSFFEGSGTTSVGGDDYWAEEEEEQSCTLTGKFSYLYEGIADEDFNFVEDHESPKDKFLFKVTPGGKLVYKPCKFLAKRNIKPRARLCGGEIVTNGYSYDGTDKIADGVCPSICCHIPENPGNTWLKKKESVGDDGTVSPSVVKTCDDLKGLSDAMIRRTCKKTLFSDEVNTAFVACPETCGLCPTSE